MSIQRFFDKSIIIRRLAVVSGNKKKFVSTGTIDAHIQRIRDEDVFRMYGVTEATHKAWVDLDDDIQEGDKAIDSDGNEYDVVMVNERDFGHNVHKEVILKRYGD